MFRNPLRQGLWAVVGFAVAAASCTQQPTKTAQTSTPSHAYYHDRGTSVGTNIPRTYADANSAANADKAHQTDIEAEQFQQLQNQFTSSGAPTGTGGH